jgi:hypothetical protein|tara:strand:- start:128 stop:292 length:165 start_codon:yes stop_codon:yes gene_type:complete
MIRGSNPVLPTGGAASLVPEKIGNRAMTNIQMREMARMKGFSKHESPAFCLIGI